MNRSLREVAWSVRTHLRVSYSDKPARPAFYALSLHFAEALIDLGETSTRAQLATERDLAELLLKAMHGWRGAFASYIRGELGAFLQETQNAENA